MADVEHTSNSDNAVTDLKGAQNVDVTPEGKNLKSIKCQRCPSTILLPEIANLVTNDFSLPEINPLAEDLVTTTSDKKYWCVDNMYAFENVGFSKNVEKVKYLICADCEIGPIGFHDIETKLSYVSLSRVTSS